MNGNTIEETLSSTTPPCGWREFCELHASATAREVAQHYRRFARTRLPQDVVTPEKFSRHFSAIFQHHFRREVAKEETPPPPMTGRTCTFSGVLDYREAGRPVGGASFVILPPKLEREQPLQNFTTHRPLGHTQGVELAENSAPLPASPLCSRVNVLSQFGRSVRQLFTKQPSREDSVYDSSGDEFERRGGASGSVEHSPATEAPGRFQLLNRLRKHSTKWRRDTGSVYKEGYFRYLEVNDTISDTVPSWMNCRLLVRRTNNRFHLELYNPPKVRVVDTGELAETSLTASICTCEAEVRVEQLCVLSLQFFGDGLRKRILNRIESEGSTESVSGLSIRHVYSNIRPRPLGKSPVRKWWVLCWSVGVLLLELAAIS